MAETKKSRARCASERPIWLIERWNAGCADASMRARERAKIPNGKGAPTTGAVLGVDLISTSEWTYLDRWRTKPHTHFFPSSPGHQFFLSPFPPSPAVRFCAPTFGWAAIWWYLTPCCSPRRAMDPQGASTVPHHQLASLHEAVLGGSIGNAANLAKCSIR